MIISEFCQIVNFENCFFENLKISFVNFSAVDTPFQLMNSVLSFEVKEKCFKFIINLLIEYIISKLSFSGLANISNIYNK